MCPESLFEKQVCPNLPRCPHKRYEGTFNPFPADGMSGYSTPWSARGLESGKCTECMRLKKPNNVAIIYADGLKAEEDPGSQSYFYETPKNEKYTNVPSYPMGGGSNQRPPSNWDQSDQSPFGNSYIYGGNTRDGPPDLPTHSSYTAPSPSEEVSFMTSQNICQIDF